MYTRLFRKLNIFKILLYFMIHLLQQTFPDLWLLVTYTVGLSARNCLVSNQCYDTGINCQCYRYSRDKCLASYKMSQKNSHSF